MDAATKVMLAATIVIAVATVIYVLLTAWLAVETYRLRASQRQPYLAISIVPREEWVNWIDMVVENLGPGVAKDIQFTVSKDFNVLDDVRLSDVGLFKEGIKHFSPGQRYRFFLTSIAEGGAEVIETEIAMSAAYKDVLGKTHSQDFCLRFAELRHLSQLGEPPLYKMAKSMEKIERHLAGRLKADVYTSADRRAHQQRVEEYARELATNPPGDGDAPPLGGDASETADC